MNDTVAGGGGADTIAGGGGADTVASASWRDTLPTDLKDKFPDLKDPTDVFKSYVGLRGKVSDPEAWIKRPGEKAGPEELQAFEGELNKLRGVPADAKDYTFTLDEVGKKIINEKMLDEHFRPVFKAAGLTQKQIDVVMDGYVKGFAPDLKLMQEEEQAGIDALKKEWGADYEANSGKSLAYMNSHAGEVGKRLAAKYGNDPDMMLFIQQQANKNAEDATKWKDGAAKTEAAPSTKEAVSAKGRDLMAQRNKHEAGSAEYLKLDKEVKENYAKLNTMQ